MPIPYSTPTLDALRPLLSPTQLDIFVIEHMTTPAAFRHVTVADLRAAPFCLSTGLASTVLDAVNPPAGAETPLNAALRAIAFAATDAKVEDSKHRLLTADVSHVVLGDDGLIRDSAACALYRHVAAGGSVPRTWQGQRVVAVSDLARPPVWCSPRPPHRELQDGVDEISRVRWLDLQLDGMRVAAHGYARGFFDGMTEAAAFSAVQGPFGERVRDDARAAGTDLSSYDSVLLGARAADDPQGGGGGGGGGTTTVRSLDKLLLSMFDGGEIRRLIRFGPDGTRLAGELPGLASPDAQVVHGAIDVLRRHGRLDVDFRDRVVAERPRRAAEIRAVFAAMGVK